MMNSVGCSMVKFGKKKPYIAMFLVQTIFAGMALLSKAAIAKGMNPYVFVVYRQAFATFALAPFAYFLESDKAVPLSSNMVVKIFFSSLLGMTPSLNLFCVALHYTTATLAAATMNSVPTITFLMAVLLRLESISIKQWSGKTKVLGSALSMSGALIYIFIKGPPVNILNRRSQTNNEEIQSQFVKYGSRRDRVKGSLIMLSANTTWSLWFIMQARLVKKYPAKLRLVTLQCFFSCIQSAVLAMATQRNISSWKLGPNLNLISVAYCGIMVTAFSFWLRVWTIEKKGPLFAALFNPLSLVITAIFSAFFWKEILHLGSVCGAILLVGGLYSVLWGKSREVQETKSNEVHKLEETKEETKLDCITHK